MAIVTRTEPIFEDESGRLVPLTTRDLADRVIEQAGGVEALRGPQGEQGLRGDAGATGADGRAGADGADGADGRTILPTTGRPSDATGLDGDFALDAAAGVLYGPKAAGAWPAGVSIVGPQGDPGRDAVIGDGSIEARHLAAALKPSGAAAATDEALRRLGSAAGEAAAGAAAVGFVAHGATAGTTRPSGYGVVVWIGSVDPTNKDAGDLWVRTA